MFTAFTLRVIHRQEMFRKIYLSGGTPA
jgi:hypothetical protein